MSSAAGAPVHVIAVGARCAVGLTAASAAAAIRASISRVAEHPSITDAIGEPVRCGRDRQLDPRLTGPQRLAALAAGPLREVLDQLARVRPLPREVPLLLALPEPRPGFRASDAAAVSRALSTGGAPGLGPITVDRVGEGHAGVLSALAMAVERLQRPSEDLLLVGGVDSYLDADTLDWLESDRRLARAEVRSGFSPGEGAAILAVATDAARRRLGAPSLATVRAVGCAREPLSPKSSTGVLGQGMTEAVVRATRGLRLPGELITDTFGDVNGERSRAEEWGFALLRTSDRFRDGTAYVTAVPQCGDVGAASGGLGCVLAVQAWQRRYAHGERALVFASSWGGLRAAALLEKPAR